MRMRWKTSPSLTCMLFFMLLLNGMSLIPNGRHKLLYEKGHKEYKCVGCVLLVSIIEQLAQIHNSTAKEALERLCSYLPEKLHLQGTCFLVAEIFGPNIIKLIESKMNADVVCHSIRFCTQKAGQPFCHLYPPPKVGLDVAIKQSERMVSNQIKNVHRLSGICSLPFMKHLCENIQSFIHSKLPYEDFDGDKFSTFPTLRGYHWRGRDCDDRQASVHPGRRPDNWDAEKDSNCNGIWGVNPKDGIPYEQKFCNGTESKGVIILGDSAEAHFHIPPEWVTASQMSKKAFSNLLEVFSDELDWPQFSGATGFLHSTIGGWTESFYLHLRRRNRCNHRDYQNISKNGGSSRNILDLVKSLARSQQFDKPAIVTFAMIGNAVCNGHSDTVKHMTRPEQMRSNVVQTLHYLNSLLPKGSHVILTGLVDGRFLWDNLHDRYHPLGQLNKDVTYGQFYSFLSCLQTTPCTGWMSTNATLRNATSERALQLSNVLKQLAKSEKYANFDVFYMDFPLKEIAKMWHQLGGEAWQLVEPVDGFHPNQIASALGARIIWEKILREWPHVLGKENPFNDEIAAVFKDQGGH
ncbi:acyloxyacyl hydrolase isoform X2 [Rhineura floridana]|uniref:acyloxyacyl hydrolase isoform X2 n=1 Tax=Rhineura floridana TaxID=261503 RepID=UPI002AC85963|nr:acyloxyacyl hydrolase isoform X2 [Rhineura floridana]